MSKISASSSGRPVTFARAFAALSLAAMTASAASASAHAAKRSASAWDELSSAQRKQLEAGEVVYVAESVPGTNWPKIRAYAIVDATAEQSAAVFWDFERQHEYIDAMKESRIDARISARVVDVTYGIDAPWPFPMIEYTCRNTMIAAGAAADGGRYRFDFRMLRSNALAKSDGTASFEPHGSGTLMNYVGQVQPNDMFSFAPPSLAQDVVEAVAKHMKDRVEQERASEPALLDSEVAALRRAAPAAARR